MKVPYVRVVVERDTLEVIASTRLATEVPILQQMWGNQCRIQEVTSATADVTARDEAQRLSGVFGAANEDESWVQRVYGVPLVANINRFIKDGCPMDRYDTTGDASFEEGEDSEPDEPHPEPEGEPDGDEERTSEHILAETAELRAQLEARGISYDGRWGVRRLRQELEAADA